MVMTKILCVCPRTVEGRIFGKLRNHISPRESHHMFRKESVRLVLDGKTRVDSDNCSNRGEENGIRDKIGIPYRIRRDLCCVREELRKCRKINDEGDGSYRGECSRTYAKFWVEFSVEKTLRKE